MTKRGPLLSRGWEDQVREDGVVVAAGYREDGVAGDRDPAVGQYVVDRHPRQGRAGERPGTDQAAPGGVGRVPVAGRDQPPQVGVVEGAVEVAGQDPDR